MVTICLLHDMLLLTMIGIGSLLGVMKWIGITLLLSGGLAEDAFQFSTLTGEQSVAAGRSKSVISPIRKIQTSRKDGRGDCGKEIFKRNVNSCFIFKY